MISSVVLCVASIHAMTLDGLPEPPATPGSVSWSAPVAPLPREDPRWSATGSVLIGIADAFYGKVVPALGVRRRTGPVSVELFGAKAFRWVSPALEICATPSSCVSPTASQLSAATGQLDWYAGAGAVVRANAAKWSLGGLDAIGVVFEASAGLAAVGYRWADATTHDEVSPGLRWGLAAGLRVADPLELRIDLAGLAYRTDVRSAAGLERQLMIGTSIAWLPGGP